MALAIKEIDFQNSGLLP